MSYKLILYYFMMYIWSPCLINLAEHINAKFNMALISLSLKYTHQISYNPRIHNKYQTLKLRKVLITWKLKCRVFSIQ